MRFRCTCCDQVHEGIPDVGFPVPDLYLDVPEAVDDFAPAGWSSNVIAGYPVEESITADRLAEIVSPYLHGK
jgi:hypothetical protein